MSDSPFLRPGAYPEPSPGAWPYEQPQVESDPQSSQATVTFDDTSEVSPSPQSSPRGRRRGAVFIAGLVGLVIGGVIAGLLSEVLDAEPEPIAITLEVFPEYIENLTRPDLVLATAEDPAAAGQFERHFEAQRERYRFAYGGDGASVDYGQFLLTIVNGSQSLPLPSDAAGTPGSASPILISLDSDTVSCIFQPEVGLYNSAVLQAPADLSAQGWTQCVLNDDERRISLKLDSRVPGGSVETSMRFARILERVHRSLDA